MHQQIIIFARQDSESSKKLPLIVKNNIRSEDFELCTSLKDFFKRFRAPNNYSTVLLLIENHSDFDELFNVRDFFEGLRVFLILPDREEITISRGNMLFPRFVTYIDSDFDELSAIFRNVLAKYKAA